MKAVSDLSNGKRSSKYLRQDSLVVCVLSLHRSKPRPAAAADSVLPGLRGKARNLEG